MNAAFPVPPCSCFVYISESVKGKNMDLEQWTVGGRGFGTMFVFY